MTIERDQARRKKWHTFFKMGGHKIWHSPWRFFEQMDKERATLREVPDRELGEVKEER